MKYALVITCIVLAPIISDAKSIEEHILVSYSRLVDQLEEHGFQGPLAEEVGRYALIRQVIEDGSDREHSVSIVGMCPGGANERAMCDAGLIMGETNGKGIKLGKVTSNGETFYALYGPRANVVSAVAVTLLWDKYVNGDQTHRFKDEEIKAWNASKDISRKIDCKVASKEEIDRYYGELAAPRRKAIEKANCTYSPTAAATINRIVNDMGAIFDFALF
jgi:hypothetical protein